MIWTFCKKKLRKQKEWSKDPSKENKEWEQKYIKKKYAKDDKGFSTQAAKIVIMKFCAKDVKNGRAT